MAKRGRKPIPLPPEAVVLWVAYGWPVAAVAAAVGMRPSTVRQRLAELRAELPIAGGDRSLRRWQARRRWVARLYQAGMSQTAIARRLGVSQQAVSKLLKRAGVRCRGKHTVRRLRCRRPGCRRPFWTARDRSGGLCPKCAAGRRRCARCRQRLTPSRYRRWCDRCRREHPAWWRRAAELYLSGFLTQTEVAERFGVTQSAVSRAVKRLGLTAKPQGPIKGAVPKRLRHLYGRHWDVYRNCRRRRAAAGQ